MTGIVTTEIDIGRILHQVGTPESGALDIFVGTVRNHSAGCAVSHLEYTAYGPMAEKLMEEIEQEIRARWPVYEVVMVHRIGRLEVGDIAVVTAVSSAHRKEAFEACRYAIDRVKEIVPIWKKEYGVDEGVLKSAEGGAGTNPMDRPLIP